jgi:hypothetical protein
VVRSQSTLQRHYFKKKFLKYKMMFNIEYYKYFTVKKLNLNIKIQ